MEGSDTVVFRVSPRLIVTQMRYGTPRMRPQTRNRADPEHSRDPSRFSAQLRLKTRYYFEYTKWPRRFCCQHASFDSVQNGFSLP